MNVNLHICAMNKTELQQQLNSLLANLHVHYQNLRTHHWYIGGENFFSLHAQFEQWYDDAKIKIDEVAERLLTIDAKPLFKQSDYLATSIISEVEASSNAKETVSAIQADLETLIKIEYQILNTSDNLADEGTNALASDYIAAHEKMLWMCNAFLKA